MEIHFPQFRKYKNNKSYFKILSMNAFEEITVGPKDKITLHKFDAKILPDRNFIMDILNSIGLYVERISEEEYESKKAEIN